ncbi:MAG: hypothetical protein V3S12_03120 [Acidiferrobacterales bacterium]
MIDLNLKIPGKKTTAWAAETTAEATRVWLNSLPYSDNTQTTRELYRSLYTLNRLEIDPARRIDILELHRTPVSTVTAVWQQMLAQQSLPLAPNLRRMMEIVRELNREMAIGYKIVLLGQQRSWKRRLLRKPPVLAVERAMRYLGEVLVHCYHTYLPFPSQIWSELNELYRFGEFTAILDSPVAIDVGRDAGATTIIERYKQISLLGLCNPYQLPQGDARKIHMFLYRWANMAVVGGLGSTSATVACFQIDLLRDAPPVYYNRPIDPIYGKRARVLDATLLVAKVKSFIQRLEDGEPASQLELGTECLDVACLELLRRMLRAWGAVTARQHSRSSGKGYLSVCVGLSAVHFFSDGQRPFSPLLDSGPMSAADANETATGEPLDIDVDLIDDSASNETATAVVVPEDYHLTRWEIVDQSASGLFLRGVEVPGMKIRIGEMLGVQFGDNVEGDWWPAAVRRMQADATGTIEIGVELLASRLLPAAVCAASGRVPFHAALLLPALETSDKKSPRSIVVPRGIFRGQADLLLVTDDAPEPVRIRPLKLVERTNSFEQFYFAEVMLQD